MLFTVTTIGARSLTGHLRAVDLTYDLRHPSSLHSVVLLGDEWEGTKNAFFENFKTFLALGKHASTEEVQRIEKQITADDVLNIQFTSGKHSFCANAAMLMVFRGTTGLPKAALLTHKYAYIALWVYMLTMHCQEHPQQRSVCRRQDASNSRRRTLLFTSTISLFRPRYGLSGYFSTWM